MERFRPPDRDSEAEGDAYSLRRSVGNYYRFGFLSATGASIALVVYSMATRVFAWSVRWALLVGILGMLLNILGQSLMIPEARRLRRHRIRPWPVSWLAIACSVGFIVLVLSDLLRDVEP